MTKSVFVLKGRNKAFDHTIGEIYYNLAVEPGIAR